MNTNGHESEPAECVTDGEYLADLLVEDRVIVELKRLSNHSAEHERIAYLEKKIQTKDEVLAELMAEHVALKKRLGNSDRGLGSARYAGPDRGFRPALVGEDRDRRRAVHRVAQYRSQQVLRLARTLR